MKAKIEITNIEKSLLARAVICTCPESDTVEEVSMEYALEKLDGWWKKNDILPVLAAGDTLWTPDAQYRVKDL